MPELLTPNDLTATTAQAAGPVLRIHHRGQGELSDLPLGAGKWTIGSSAQCQVHLPSPDVRPLQCLITVVDAKAQVTRWAAGVRLNGRDFSQAVLAGGDRLTIAGWEIEYRCEQAAATDGCSVEPVTEATAGPSEAIEERLEELESAGALLAAAEPVEALKEAIAPTGTHRITPKDSSNFQDKLVLQLWTANHAARRRAKSLINGIRAARFHADAMAADLSAMETELDLARAAYDCHLDSDESAQSAAASVGQTEAAAALQAEVGNLRTQLATAQEHMAQLTAAYEAAVAEMGELREAESKAAVPVALEARIGELEAELAARVDELGALTADLEKARDQQLRTAELHRAETERAAGLELSLLELQAPPVEHAEPQATPAEAVQATATENLWGSVSPVVEQQPEDNSPGGWAPFAAIAGDQPELEQPIDELPPKAAEASSGLGASPEVPQTFAVSFSPVELEAHGATRAPLVQPNDGRQSTVEQQPTAPAWAVATEPAAAASSSTSFIDKYRHLLEDDAEPAAMPSSGRPLIEDEFLSPSKVETCASGSEESDEALEAYMANMMRRVRSSTPSMAPSSQGPTSELLNLGAAHGALPQREEAPGHQPADFLSEEPISFEDLKLATRKVPLARDLSALREIANSSARGAIATHSQRQTRESAITKMIVAATATVSAVYLMASAPEVTGWQFWAGAATCAVGITAAVQVLIIERRGRG